jgi:histone deacetylase 1/2
MSSAMTYYGVDTNWYVDSGATDHVTGELEKFTVHDKYGVHDQVHTTSGIGMEISHVGSTFLRTHNSKIHLKNILHVPKASKSLISINCLARDNNAFLEFQPIIFLSRNRGRRGFSS